jgi:hypothetical protein
VGELQQFADDDPHNTELQTELAYPKFPSSGEKWAWREIVFSVFEYRNAKCECLKSE